MLKNFKRLLSFSALYILFVFCCQNSASASATLLPSNTVSGVYIVEQATENGDNYVRYPQLEEMDDPVIQQTINDAIVEEAFILQRLITLGTLQQNGTGLQVSYTAYLKDSLFSTVISAKGMMENMRSGHSYTALAYNLVTGERLHLTDFFADSEAAVAWMEEQLIDTQEDAYSYYLEHADITPLPKDSFTFDQNGITFYYPYEQFALLSGYSASAQFQYGELQSFLLADVGSVPSLLDAILPQYSDTEIRQHIDSIVAQGTLPYLSVHLGDAIPDLISNYRLTRTPDQFPGGRYFQFEDPAFRSILILSDALTSGYEASVVEGILAFRMNLYGIQTGITTQSRWREILGDPVSVYYDSAIASDFGLPIGTADTYAIDGRQLMLYADENGLLYAVRLRQ